MAGQWLHAFSMPSICVLRASKGFGTDRETEAQEADVTGPGPLGSTGGMHMTDECPGSTRKATPHATQPLLTRLCERETQKRILERRSQSPALGVTMVATQGFYHLQCLLVPYRDSKGSTVPILATFQNHILARNASQDSCTDVTFNGDADRQPLPGIPFLSRPWVQGPP